MTEVTKPYAWKMRLTYYDGSERESVRVARSERAARRMVEFQRRVRAVVVIETFTEDEYHRCYGCGPMRNS
jgi:hypothetical protein